MTKPLKANTKWIARLTYPDGSGEDREFSWEDDADSAWFRAATIWNTFRFYTLGGKYSALGFSVVRAADMGVV